MTKKLYPLAYPLIALTLLACPLACSDGDGEDGDGESSDDDGDGGDADSGSGSASSKGSGGQESDIEVAAIGGSLPEVEAHGGQGGTGPYELPEEFEVAELGGWFLGKEIDSDHSDADDSDTDSDSGGCGSEITGIVRDFRRGDRDDGHPDFGTYTGTGEKGILEAELGEDLKPVLASGDHEFITSQEGFDQWYHTTEEANRAFVVTFSFEPNEDVLTFESRAFFPLDGEGFGNQDENHNFGFTTEIHTEFRYNGGETFRFTGDDDLWVFINGRLAIDLGGLHPEQNDSLDLDEAADELGIETGEIYALDLFHAERHASDSNFRVDTNLQFTRCNIVVPDEIPIR